MKTVTTQRMKIVDAQALTKYGIPSLILMENAGISIYRALENILRKNTAATIAILCGSGNNAGDGFVVARHLFNNGYKVTVFMIKNPSSFKGDLKTNYLIASKMGIKINRFSSNINFKKFTIIVDALLGTGLNGFVKKNFARAITTINASKTKVLSIDIPSGLNADTGEPNGLAIKADYTVTLGAIKKGLMTKTANTYVGKLSVGYLSLPAELL